MNTVPAPRSFTRTAFAGLLLLALGLLITAPAQAEVLVTVENNTAIAQVALGGTPEAPQYQATLTLKFSSPTALTAENLGITAHIIDVTDPLLLARLPLDRQATLIPEFPVLISVSPVVGSGFSFEGSVKADLYTRDLNYTTRSSFRLFKAAPGGIFYDHTTAIEPGSIRVRYRTGAFSDFILVSDSTPEATVAQAGFVALADRIIDGVADPILRDLLLDSLEVVRLETEAGQLAAARIELARLEALIDEAEALGQIPSSWLAGGSLDNVSGTLMALVDTLDFYLERVEEDDDADSGQTPEPDGEGGEGSEGSDGPTVPGAGPGDGNRHGDDDDADDDADDDDADDDDDDD